MNCNYRSALKNNIIYQNSPMIWVSEILNIKITVSMHLFRILIKKINFSEKASQNVKKVI